MSEFRQGIMIAAVGVLMSMVVGLGIDSGVWSGWKALFGRAIYFTTAVYGGWVVAGALSHRRSR